MSYELYKYTFKGDYSDLAVLVYFFLQVGTLKGKNFFSARANSFLKK